MLDWMFIILFVLAVLLILIAIADFSAFWSLTSITMSIVIWFILGLGVLRMETEYTVYNVTSEQIESGLHSYTPVTNVFISYLFSYMFTGVLIIYLIIRAYEEYKIFKGVK